MNELLDYLPLFLPVLLIEVALAVTALVHVLRHPHYRFGNKPFWIVVVLLVQIIGPVLYFLAGRGEDE